VNSSPADRSERAFESNMMTSLHRNWRRIATSIQYRGIPFTMLWCLMFALRMTPTKWFRTYRAKQLDRRYGLDTAGVIEPSALGLTSSEAELSHEYQPCSPETLSEVLSNLAHQFPRYTFVDLGSGKGVALLAASMFPFRRIVGIEWSPRLASIARENVGKFSHRQQKCHDIVVLDGDAAAYELPEDPLVIFMFNPFKDELVRRVLRNIGDSLTRCPRHVVVLYYNPVCKQVIDQVDFLHRVEWKDRCPIAIYETQRVALQQVEARVEPVICNVVLSR
jgi:tRNA A58 N-methylase Trm61